jgi:hypothetical protein
MPCSVCAAPLFTIEQPLCLCRTHGLAGTTLHNGLAVLKLDGTIEVEPWYRRDSMNSLRDLGSILPPIPERGESVRLVRHVVVVPRVELTDAPDLVMRAGEIDPVTRQATGRDKGFRLVKS